MIYFYLKDFYKMNFEILQFEIYNYIDDLFNSMHPENKVKYIKAYDNADKDLEQLGKQLVYCLGLNNINNNLDIMIKPDYFIFNYNNIYIIINFSIDLNDKCIYKILTVNNRNEALRYRYSY